MVTKKDLYIPFGILLGFSIIVLSIYLISGRDVLYFISFPSFLIVIGGTLISLMISFRFSDFKYITPTMKSIINKEELNMKELLPVISYFFDKNHNINLQKEIDKIKHPFIKNSVEFLSNDIEKDTLRLLLKNESDKYKTQYNKVHSIFQFSGDLSPAWGMLGTIIGLAIMLQNLNDISTLYSSVGICLITTIYGVLFSYLICYPIANKIEFYANDEIKKIDLISEIIISISNHENPIIIKEKWGNVLSDEEKELVDAMIKETKMNENIKEKLENLLKDDMDDLLSLIVEKKKAKGIQKDA